MLCFLWFEAKVFLGDSDTHMRCEQIDKIHMGVDVSKFSEVDIKMDGVLGSGIVHLIWKFQITKTIKQIILLRDHMFLVGQIYYETY